MTIDINNIKPGDRIVVEFEVTDVHTGALGAMWVRSATNPDNAARTWVMPEHILEHKPKPPELKVGDTFPPNNGFDGFWTIHGIDGDNIWAKYSYSNNYATLLRKEVLARMGHN